MPSNGKGEDVQVATNPSADPTRSLPLLWGPPPRPGRSGLTLAAIVAAATKLADEQGLAAVSMRQLAATLGVGTMSLYGYVPGREELVELMADGAWRGLYADLDEPSAQGSWRQGLRFVAERNWAVLTAHPWMTELSATRPVLGPHLSDKYEAELRVLDGIGLSDLEMDSVLALVTAHTESTARILNAQRSTVSQTGESDLQWWETMAPVLQRLMPAGRYPVADRVGRAAGEFHQAAAGAQHALHFGLDRIIDGVQALIDKTRADCV